MTIPLILAVVALAFGLADEFQAEGRSLAGWGVIAISIGLLWGHLGWTRYWRCLVGHDWRPMKWGDGRLDCRDCARCGVFQTWVYDGFYDADRTMFPDARLLVASQSQAKIPT